MHYEKAFISIVRFSRNNNLEPNPIQHMPNEIYDNDFGSIIEIHFYNHFSTLSH